MELQDMDGRNLAVMLKKPRVVALIACMASGIAVAAYAYCDPAFAGEVMAKVRIFFSSAMADIPDKEAKLLVSIPLSDSGMVARAQPFVASNESKKPARRKPSASENKKRSIAKPAALPEEHIPSAGRAAHKEETGNEGAGVTAAQDAATVLRPAEPVLPSSIADAGPVAVLPASIEFAAPEIRRVLIYKIQIGGKTPSDELIALYNPNGHEISLAGWSVKKKTASGKEYSLVAESRFEGKLIRPQSYLLLANEGGYAGTVPYDIGWAKSNTIAADNTVIAYNQNGDVEDKVGFGEAADFETAPAPNPVPGAAIVRTSDNDTDDNSKDFAPGG